MQTLSIVRVGKRTREPKTAKLAKRMGNRGRSPPARFDVHKTIRPPKIHVLNIDWLCGNEVQGR
jgi:hypothetical protein